MHYEGTIIRPPSEAMSILLQVTVGCSHNRCTFCGAYKGERFRIKSDEIIDEDIDEAAARFRHSNRLFLCDGDALIIPYKRLYDIFVRMSKKLPWLKRIGLYGNAKSILRKKSGELEVLRKLGLRIIYMGLESGDEETLSRMKKKNTPQEMVEAAKRVKDAGITLSVTVLLGLGGIERSDVHAIETGKVLSMMDPEYVGALSLMVLPNTGLYQELKTGVFELPGPKQLLRELRLMVEYTDLSDGFFTSNHASNYIAIKAKLPGQKVSTLEFLDRAIRGDVRLRPEWMRGL